MKTTSRPLSILVSLTLGACAGAPPSSSPDPTAAASAPHASGGGSTTGAATPSPSTARRGASAEATKKPSATPRQSRVPALREARSRFEDVLRLVRERYVDADLSEDELYTGAIEGLMRRLVQHRTIAVNELLSPERLERLRESVRGVISGVGVVIAGLEGGLYKVLGTIPGSSAAQAGLAEGDLVVQVAGRSLKALDLAGVVKLIRGAAGTKVELVLQRETETRKVTLERREVVVPTVRHEVLDGGVGYLAIDGFDEKTPGLVDDALAALDRASAGARLVLDLRACPGGLLPAFVQVARRFLPAGARIASIHRRAGVSEPLDVPAENRIAARRIALLVGEGTASSAEMLAAALRENERATLLGTRTAGKWTVEEILPLPERYGLRLTVGRIHSPKGHHLQDEGLRPDIELPPAQPSPSLRRSPKDDPQVRSALGVLGVR